MAITKELLKKVNEDLRRGNYSKARSRIGSTSRSANDLRKELADAKKSAAKKEKAEAAKKSEPTVSASATSSEQRFNEFGAETKKAGYSTAGQILRDYSVESRTVRKGFGSGERSVSVETTFRKRPSKYSSQLTEEDYLAEERQRKQSLLRPSGESDVLYSQASQRDYDLFEESRLSQLKKKAYNDGDWFAEPSKTQRQARQEYLVGLQDRTYSKYERNVVPKVEGALDSYLLASKSAGTSSDVGNRVVVGAVRDVVRNPKENVVLFGATAVISPAFGVGAATLGRLGTAGKVARGAIGTGFVGGLVASEGTRFVAAPDKAEALGVVAKDFVIFGVGERATRGSAKTFLESNTRGRGVKNTDLVPGGYKIYGKEVKVEFVGEQRGTTRFLESRPVVTGYSEVTGPSSDVVGFRASGKIFDVSEGSVYAGGRSRGPVSGYLNEPESYFFVSSKPTSSSASFKITRAKDFDVKGLALNEGVERYTVGRRINEFSDVRNQQFTNLLGGQGYGKRRLRGKLEFFEVTPENYDYFGGGFRERGGRKLDFSTRYVEGPQGLVKGDVPLLLDYAPYRAQQKSYLDALSNTLIVISKRPTKRLVTFDKVVARASEPSYFAAGSSASKGGQQTVTLLRTEQVAAPKVLSVQRTKTESATLSKQKSVFSAESKSSQSVKPFSFAFNSKTSTKALAESRFSGLNAAFSGIQSARRSSSASSSKASSLVGNIQSNFQSNAQAQSQSNFQGLSNRQAQFNVNAFEAPLASQSLFGRGLFGESNTRVGKSRKSEFPGFGFSGVSGGFGVLVRRRGKFEKVNRQPLTFRDAFKLGSRTVFGNPARSFKITGTRKKGDEFGGADFGNMLRPSKREAGVFVEKSGFAIDSPGEVRGISLVGARSQRKNGGLF